MSRFVIIGNSAAAAGAVEAIRKNDTGSDITLISAEKHHIYSRPLISYYLQGKVAPDKLDYRPRSFYEDNNCTLLSGVTAEKIDTENKKVFTDDNREVCYDSLLLATGSKPFIPPTPGYEDVKNKFAFASLDDALLLEKALFPQARVLIIGAGLIGLKCAEGIREKVGKITVVDFSDRILSSILDDDTADTVRAHLEKRGIDFMLSDCVTAYSGNEATLRSSAVIPFDILVTAVGVRANTGLAADAGILTDRGILIDDTGSTSLAGIYAAGDCAQSTDTVTGQSKIMALLPNAYMQGENAGNNMCGKKSVFNKAMLMNSIGLFGLHIMTAGSYEGETYTVKNGGNIKKLFYHDNRLYGFILAGNVDKAGIYTALIREKTPLDSIDFGLICEKPSLMAFSRQIRERKLGGIDNDY